jgi:RHS repeat-associated protein
MNPSFSFADRYRIYVASLLFALLAGLPSFGQSATDGTTPPSIAPGSPAGSYALSGFDTVNLYSGKPNFLVPLHSVGGRGEASYSIAYPIQRNWTISVLPNEDGSYSYVPASAAQPHNGFIGDNPVAYFSVGYMAFRSAPDSAISNSVNCTGGRLAGSTIVDPDGRSAILTRITWTSSDGTETEFVDQGTGGKEQTQPYGCNGDANGNGNAQSRGTVFVSTDGSAATFVSISTIYDCMYYAGCSGGVNGWLFFPNGLRYTINNGDVSEIRDRNGNEVTFCEPGWSGCSGFSATDPLGRTTNITYATFPNGTTAASDTIAFTGFAGTPRSISVNYGQLQSYLAPGQNVQTYGCLFPELTNGSTQTPFNPYVTSSIGLPDGRSYSFLYNSYGEVAQVTLPTGGAIQYQYGGADGASDPSHISPGTCSANPSLQYSGVTGQYTIQRRLLVRKVLPSGASGPVEQWTTYSANFGSSSQSNTAVTVKHLDPSDPTGNTVISQETHLFYLNPVNSVLDVSNPAHYSPWQEGKEYESDYYDGSGQNRLRSIVSTWTQRACGAYPNDAACWFESSFPANSAPPNATSSVSNQVAPAHYTAVTEVDTTLSDTNQLSKQTFAYDQYNNRTDTYEYDYGQSASQNPTAGPLLRHTSRTFATTINGVAYDTISAAAQGSNIHLRDLVASETVTDINNNTASHTTITYDSYGTMTDYGPVAGHDSGYGTSYTTRGNPTSKQSYTSASSYIATQNGYDTLGNVASATDGNGYATTITFSSPDYAFPKSISKSVSGKTLTWGKGYDFNTGQVTTFTEPNTGTTTTYSDQIGENSPDPLDRLKLVTRPDGETTQYSYDDTNQIITTSSDQSSVGDGKIASRTYFDGFGRQIQTRTFEDGNVSGSNYISTEQTFDALGRAHTTSLPHRPNATAHFTTTTYDPIGRVLTVATDDGATTSTSYSGQITTVKDPPCQSAASGISCNQRASTTDAAGRLKAVTENISSAAVTTSYAYSASDNLIAVCQGGSFDNNNNCAGGQGRQYTYDEMSRLVSATNPETSTGAQTSGTTSYTSYDNNGNLLSKTDARGTVTTMTYDQMNRITGKSYSGGNGAPAVTYCYDGTVAASGSGCTSPSISIPNALNHLTQVYSAASATTYTAFDPVGRVTASGQQTPAASATPYQFGTAANPGYTYNLAGEMTAEVYPSGRKVSYTYDAAGRTKYVTNPGTKLNYADLSLFNPSSNQYAYAPNGAIQSMTLGNSVVESWNWDPIRLQPTQTKIGSLLTLNYYYCPSSGSSCASNNGSMLRQTVATPALGTVTQDFTYIDGFGRLNTAQETNASSQINWSQDYGYDNYGNRAVTSGNIPYPGQTPTALSQFVETINSTSVNRNHWATGSGYDSGGNMQSAPNQGFTYDAENRLIASTQPGTPSISYAYDGDGQRVQKTVGGALTTYVYDAEGELAAEYGTPTDAQGTSYVSVDQLGSTRLLQQSLGTVRYYDYFPFGEDIPASQYGRGTGYASGVYPASGPDFLSLKFTGKERDWESGLDFSQARYYSPWQGRFGGVDPENAGADSGSPQTYHGYAYVTNNPLVNTDPDGLEKGEIIASYDPTPPQKPDPGLVLWLFLDELLVKGQLERQALAHGAEKIWNWTAQRDYGCVGSRMLGGAAAGGSGGAVLGLAGGPFAEITVPGSALAGSISFGAAGLVSGMAGCSTVGNNLAFQDTGGNAGSTGRKGGENGGPASEKTAQDMAKQIERDLGKQARREFHDAKGGGGDRTLAELKEDAKLIYEKHGRTPPKWMQ